ncbi:MAG: Glutaredoxin-4 [Alphaproteobacteria bacterium MarineAlpha6_Bin3]|jgi:monothiol glutaredoxin, Grx4 family|nr:MAG: Glutaredoxin-4 [Alphaproteobacteria bacterium MarineAlpha6_Bin3]|tara:strand:+ start:695 stop:1033 length:339 start_codon:yes stop_codon:yes gene_type:complete
MTIAIQNVEEAKETIKNNDVVLFMKGTKDMPGCGFSAHVVQILNNLKVKYTDVDVLNDQNFKESMKTFSNWPTFPQLYVKGDFVGGCDIVKEMFETGELLELLNTKGIDVKT